MGEAKKPTAQGTSRRSKKVRGSKTGPYFWNGNNRRVCDIEEGERI